MRMAQRRNRRNLHTRRSKDRHRRQDHTNARRNNTNASTDSNGQPTFRLITNNNNGNKMSIRIHTQLNHKNDLQPPRQLPRMTMRNIRSLDQGKETSRAIKSTKQHHTRKMRQLLNRKIHGHMGEETDMGLRNTRRHQRVTIHRILLQLQHRRRHNGHGLIRLQGTQTPRKQHVPHATPNNKKGRNIQHATAN